MKRSIDSEKSEYIRNTFPSNNQSVSQRKLKYGVGINDADYLTQPLVNGKQIRCPAYKAWDRILMRSYSEAYHGYQPTYRDVTVCEEWLIFSNFRKWFIENHVDDYNLDKDLLVVGNRIYSPDTCIYVPTWLNCFVLGSGARRGDYKIGVCWNKYHNKFQAQCHNPKDKGIKSEHLGMFDNELTAHKVWLERKLQIALDLKPEIDMIDLRIYPNIVEIINNIK